MDRPACACTLALTLALAACGGGHDGSPIVEPEPDGDADADGDSDGPTEPVAGKVDLLFVVDNSNSMAEEQESLIANFPRLVDALVSPTNPGTPAVTDLHVGVISSDVGVGGHAVETCDGAGDDGILVRAPRVDNPACPASLGPTLVGPSDFLAGDFACLARLGTGGCGIEQPLEAVRRALVEHRTDDNAGFLRSDSVLAVVFVTDEDDCSVEDERLLSGPDEELGPLNVRCYTHDELLEPPEALAVELQALRPGLEHAVVIGAIAGTPLGWDGSPDSLPSAIDPVDPSQLRPSCAADGLGNAMPPLRLARFADAVQGSTGFSSICQPDWRGGFEALAARISAGL